MGYDKGAERFGADSESRCFLARYAALKNSAKGKGSTEGS
jgi:hypothetical protein